MTTRPGTDPVREALQAIIANHCAIAPAPAAPAVPERVATRNLTERQCGTCRSWAHQDSIGGDCSSYQARQMGLSFTHACAGTGARQGRVARDG